jgi:cytochrome c-type biogenesis protein CcmH
MIGFWLAAAALLAGVLATLLRPLLRRARDADERGMAVAVFRRQLAELDADAAQGRLPPETADAARTEATRRLLAAADRDAEAGGLGRGGPKEPAWRIGAAIVIAGTLPVAATALYLMVGAPLAIGGRTAVDAALRAHETAELTAAAEALATRTKADPDNLDGWIMLGRAAVALQRFAEARSAYDHAIRLAPDRPELHAELGEVLVLAADGLVTPAAVAEFGEAGNDPRARYYLAEAALQRGDTEKGTAQLRALLADAPADAPWRKFIAAQVAQLAPAATAAEARQPAAAAPGAAGPTAQDIAAAQAMPPQARAAMIRGMVARLAARLEQHPNDPAGWTRLAHAYDVLGEPDKAATARSRATAAANGTAPPRR